MGATHLAMGRNDPAAVSGLREVVLPVLEAMGNLEIETLEAAVPAAR